MNLCEMKFVDGEVVVDKALGRELERKRELFRAVTKTRKALFTTLVTTRGVRDTEYARQHVASSVTLDALFEPDFR